MPDMSMRMKRKNASGNWDQVKIASSAEIVSRKSGEETVEQSLQNIETNKVNGPFNIYHDLGAIGLSAGSETIVSIFNAMPNNTLLFLPVGSGYAGSSVYPATNGTFMAVRITQEFGMAFFQQVNVNSIWTGVFYRSVSLGSDSWTGWRNYEPEKLTMDSTPTEDSPNPVTSGGLYDYLQQLATTLMQYSDTADGNISKNLNAEISAIESSLNSHTGNSNIHITTSERQLWNSKQNQLTFDSTPTSGSNNPVTSGGIKTALDQKAAANHNHDGTYVPETDVGANGGVAPLGADGKIESQYLPSYVDDVVEGTLTTFPKPGEASKIYVDTATNKSYRWSGSAYTEIGGGVALGETSSTAYRGDRGKIAYDHSQVTGNPHKLTKTDLGLENVENFKAVSTVANQGLTGTEQQNAIANLGILATLAELNFVDGVTSNIQTQLDSRLSLVPSKSIPSGSDLNTYTTVGTYMVGSGAISNDIVNTAIPNSGYALIVCSTYGSASSTRTQFAISSNGLIRFRTFSSNSWSAWGDVFSTRNKPKATQVIEDDRHQFVTDFEKTRWNNSVDGIVAYYPSSRPETDGIFDTSTDTTMLVGVSSTVNKEVYELFGSSISFVFCLQLFFSTISATTTRSQILIASDGRIASRYRVGTSGTWSSWKKYADVDHKHNYDAITGMPANRALVSDASGSIAVSAVTSTEIGYLDGVTSSIQTQLNGKASSTHNHNGTYIRLVSQSSQPTDQNTGDLWMEPI